jgi:hypothetical protein
MPPDAKARPCAPIFHIGLHKTATSWFQRRFYPAIENYRYCDRVVVRNALLAGNPYRFDAEAARAALGLDGEVPLIVCDEDLSGVLHNGGLLTGILARAIAERLHAVAPEARIVIFVREQVAMAAACYHQYVREGGTAGPARYLFPESYRHLTKARPFKTPRFDFSQFDYEGLIARYDALFGRDRVSVFAYEDFASDREGFLAVYARRLGLAPGPVSGGDAVNASYRIGTLWLARLLNLFTARSVADKSVIVHIPYWYPVRKWLLRRIDRLPLMGPRRRAEAVIGADAARWIRGEFSAMNRRLAERIDVDLAAFGYAVDAPAAPRPARAKWLQWLKN